MRKQTDLADDPLDDLQKELDAMKAIGDVVQQLKPHGQERVLQWAVSRFLPESGSRNIAGSIKSSPLPAAATGEEASNVAYDDLPSLFDASAPKTGVDKALVVGYWIQECLGSSDFVSQQINNELKHLGHGVGNITDAFNGLIAQKLVMQIRKSGITKQARKKYKLTREGIKRVKQMLQSTTNE